MSGVSICVWFKEKDREWVWDGKIIDSFAWVVVKTENLLP